VFRACAHLALAALLAAASAHGQEPKLQDPTRPFEPVRSADGGKVIAEEFVLTAVLIATSRRIAVINGRVYQLGDRVNGELITRIDPGSVRIRRGDEDVLVKLREMRATNNDGEQGQ
jgi:hypothetical protein